MTIFLCIMRTTDNDQMIIEKKISMYCIAIELWYHFQT